MNKLMGLWAAIMADVEAINLAINKGDWTAARTALEVLQVSISEYAIAFDE